MLLLATFVEVRMVPPDIRALNLAEIFPCISRVQYFFNLAILWSLYQGRIGRHEAGWLNENNIRECDRGKGGVMNKQVVSL
jgi:hypothetical protein